MSLEHPCGGRMCDSELYAQVGQAHNTLDKNQNLSRYVRSMSIKERLKTDLGILSTSEIAQSRPSGRICHSPT